MLIRWTLVAFGTLIAASIAIPSFLRARINANETAVVADTGRVTSAEHTYASANGGFFDDVSRLCKIGPGCLGIGIPGYPENAPEFLPSDIARPSPYFKDGYKREWVPNGRPKLVPQASSPSSVLDYCYRSTPRNGLRGVRSFSGTGSSVGAIYWDATGTTIACPAPHDDVCGRVGFCQ